MEMRLSRKKSQYARIFLIFEKRDMKIHEMLDFEDERMDEQEK
jgi:hypothetical protein